MSQHVLALSDFSTDERGHAVIVIYSDDEVVIQKEGATTIALSQKSVARIYKRMQEYIEGTK
jgi:hypothetical protein